MNGMIISMALWLFLGAIGNVRALGFGSLTGIGSVTSKSDSKASEEQEKQLAKAHCEQGLGDLRAGLAAPNVQAFEQRKSDIAASCAQMSTAAQKRCQDKVQQMNSQAPKSAKASEYEALAKDRSTTCDSIQQTREAFVKDYLETNALVLKSFNSAGESLKASGDFKKALKSREELNEKSFEGNAFKDVKGDTAAALEALKQKAKGAVLSSETGPMLAQSITTLTDALNKESILVVLVKPFSPPPQPGGAAAVAGSMFKKDPLEVKLSSWVPDDWDGNKKVMQWLTKFASSQGVTFPPEAAKFRPAPGFFSAGLGKLSAIAKSLMSNDFEEATGHLRASYELAGRALGMKEQMLAVTAPYDSFKTGSLDQKMVDKNVEISSGAYELLQAKISAGASLDEGSKELLQQSQAQLQEAFNGELALAGTAAMYAYAARSGNPGAVVAGVEALMLAKGIPSDLSRMAKIMSVYNAIAKANNLKEVSLTDPTTLLKEAAQ